MYDVAVVGAGLIGAAAAKHLAKKGLKVEAELQWGSEFPKKPRDSDQVPTSLYPLVIQHIAIEHGPFIVDLAIKDGDLP